MTPNGISNGNEGAMGVHTEVKRLRTAVCTVYLAGYTVYYATRAVKRNVGRDRFEVKHEITDGDERTRSVRAEGGGERKKEHTKNGRNKD